MFSIYRSQTSLTSLSAFWEQADQPLREAIMRASSEIDRQLQTAPREQGESRDDATRILFQAPLAVLYEVDEARQLVRILRTWAYRSVNQRKQRE
jgi:hypothetical protein